VDPLDSTSRMLSPHVLGEDHYNTARGVQKVLQNYKNLQDIIAILVFTGCTWQVRGAEGKCQKLPGEISCEP